jgi:hypothetical protein
MSARFRRGNTTSGWPIDSNSAIDRRYSARISSRDPPARPTAFARSERVMASPLTEPVATNPVSATADASIDSASRPPFASAADSPRWALATPWRSPSAA